LDQFASFVVHETMVGFFAELTGFDPKTWGRKPGRQVRGRIADWLADRLGWQRIDAPASVETSAADFERSEELIAAARHVAALARERDLAPRSSGSTQQLVSERLEELLADPEVRGELKRALSAAEHLDGRSELTDEAAVHRAGAATGAAVANGLADATSNVEESRHLAALAVLATLALVADTSDATGTARR
jgi:hypothetical protein